MSQQKDLLQIAAQEKSSLTAPQKRFNTLLRQIERARKTLLAWQESTSTFRKDYAEQLSPLRDQLLAGHRRWVLALDAAIERPNWTQTERSMLRDLLCEAAGELLSGSAEDAEIKALFDKHAQVDFDTEQREMRRAMKSLAETMTGLELGDDEGIETDADLMQRVRQSLQQQAQAQEEQRSAQAARRTKTAAQQRREDEALQATQSVREIYRKLASALHPDRETDAQQREVKTALMQRVNQAYQANNLLELLELQLQIEQIDASHMANASEQRLKHYNKVLAEQLAELKTELEWLETQFCLEFGLEPWAKLNPQQLNPLLEQMGRQWLQELHQQDLELHMLDNPTATKRWLKQRRQQEREAEFDFGFF